MRAAETSVRSSGALRRAVQRAAAAWPQAAIRTTAAIRATVTQAEGEGFEPSVQGLPTQRFSRPPDSTTLAPLRGDALRVAISGAGRRRSRSAAPRTRARAPRR